MRVALVLVLCSCSVLSPKATMNPTDVVTNAIVDPHTITFQIRYHYTGYGREDRGHYVLDRASGACRALKKKPQYPGFELRAVGKKPLRLDPHTTLHTIERGTARYLERRRGTGVRLLLLPSKYERVEWVAGTSLVLVDGAELVHLETGRRLRVWEADYARPFLLVGNRLFTHEKHEVVVYDLALDVMARWRPDTTIDQPWVAPARLAPGWQELAKDVRVRKTERELHVRLSGKETTQALYGTATRIAGTDVLIGEDWIHHVKQQRTYARPPGPLEVSADGGWVRGTDGVVRTTDYTPKLWRLGTLVSAGVHGIVLSDDYAHLLWVVAHDGTWRSYSFRECPY